MKPPPSSAPPTERDPPDPSQASDLVNRQLTRLFGESLFGGRLDPLESMAATQGERRHGHWGRRLGIVVLLAVVAATGTWLYRRSLARSAEHERAQAAKEVAAFLADGELDRLAQYLDIVLPPGQPLLASDPYLDLIVSAQAALYRYQDAAPARLARIAPYLTSNSGKPSRLLAQLTVASLPERAESYDALASLRPSFAKDPEYHTLMATMLEQRGDAKAARDSWERSYQAGPLWLPHRFQQCAFEARQRNAVAVARITRHMAEVAPESAWTRMAHQQFARMPSAPAGTTEPKPPSPVAQHYDELAAVFSSLATHNLASARPALGRALAAVNNQAPFVLDAFVALLATQAQDLAVEMSSYEAWPRSDRWAQAKLAELQASVAARKTAPPPKAAEPATSPEPGNTQAKTHAKTHAKTKTHAKKVGSAKKKGANAQKARSHRRK
jgi:hypothetical protein